MVLSRNLDVLAALPGNPLPRMNRFYLDANECSEDMDVADILMDMQVQEIYINI